MRTRSTWMPESIAAFSLAPMKYTCRKKRVCRTAKSKKITSSKVKRTITGKPPKLALPIHAKEGGRLETENPSVSTSAIPRAIDMVPRVAIKGLIPRLVTKTPLAMPTIPPKIKPQKIAIGIGIPVNKSIATTVDDKAITEPTERSKPPDANNIAIPMTIIAVGVMPTATARKLEKLKKYGLILAITTIIATIRAIKVSSRISIKDCNIRRKKRGFTDV